MTDEQITPLPAPASAPQSRASVPSVKPAAVRLSGSARWLVLISLVLALAAAGAVGGLFYWLQLQRVDDLRERTQLVSEINDRTQQIIQLKNELQQASSQLQQDRQALQKGTQSREELQGRMAGLEKQISQVTGSHRIDWMLKEVEHFIMLAERRLSLLGDANGALALLQEADDISRAMEEPAARPLREALLKNIHDLKIAAETSIDTDGIFIRIEDLVRRVPSLNIPRYELYQELPGTSASQELPKDGWNLFLHRFTTFLGSLVRFQKHEKAKPLLLTAERDYLAQSIVLLLEQGQLALLRGDNQAYRVSLKETRSRVDNYITLKTEESRFFLTELDALAAIQLRPPVPSIESSVQGVQVFRDYWTKEKLMREQALHKLESANDAQPAAGTEVKP